jgi:hypothetical protein
MSCCGPIRTSVSTWCTAQHAAGGLTLPAGRWGLLTFLSELVVVRVLAVVVVDDPQNFDEPKGGSQATQGCLLVGVDLGHGQVG